MAEKKKLGKDALEKAVKERDYAALEGHDWTEPEIREYFDVRQKDDVETDQVMVRNNAITCVFYRERKIDGEIQRRYAGLKDRRPEGLAPWKKIINIPRFGPAEFKEMPAGTIVKGLYTEEVRGQQVPIIMVKKEGEKQLVRIEGKRVEL